MPDDTKATVGQVLATFARLVLYTSLWLVLVAGCVTYKRGEQFTCFAPFQVEKCKPPPYDLPESLR